MVSENTRDLAEGYTFLYIIVHILRSLCTAAVNHLDLNTFTLFLGLYITAQISSTDPCACVCEWVYTVVFNKVCMDEP